MLESYFFLTEIVKAIDKSTSQWPHYNWRVNWMLTENKVLYPNIYATAGSLGKGSLFWPQGLYPHCTRVSESAF